MPKPKTETSAEVGLPPTLVVLGAQRPTAPPSYAIRESLCLSFGEAHSAYAAGKTTLNLHRVCAAAICACCQAFGPEGLTWQQVDYDVLRYGDACYSWLRQAGLPRAELVKIGSSVVTGLTGILFPKEAEVAGEEAFSGAEEDGQTSSASA